MDFVTLLAYSLDATLRAMHRSVRIEVLRAEHVDAAARLLSYGFVHFEPLCQKLGILEQDIRPFFLSQTAHVAEQGLGIVALDRQGKVIGAVTIEDHLARFKPDPAQVTKELAAIGNLLDSLDLPSELAPSRKGEVYHCGLASVARGTGHAPILVMMFLGIFRHLRASGYKRGYAKVSNPRIAATFRKLERLTGIHGVFSARAKVEASTFCHDGDVPFSGREFPIVLYSWPMTFTKGRHNESALRLLSLPKVVLGLTQQSGVSSLIPFKVR